MNQKHDDDNDDDDCFVILVSGSLLIEEEMRVFPRIQIYLLLGLIRLGFSLLLGCLSSYYARMAIYNLLSLLLRFFPFLLISFMNLGDPF